jgi:hypothetical protein
VDRSDKDKHLVNDAQTLTEFLNSTKIPVVTVTILTDRDVKLDLKQGLSNVATEHERNAINIPRHTCRMVVFS